MSLGRLTNSMKIKRLARTLLPMAVLILLPHPADAAADPSEKTFPNLYAAPKIIPPADVHPRVFVTKQDIPEIKARLTQGELATPINILDRITKTAASPIPSDGALATYDMKMLTIIKDSALLYLLNDDAPAGNIQYLVVDLAPGAWSVTKDDSAVGKYEVKAGEGVLYFKGAPGKYTVRCN